MTYIPKKTAFILSRPMILRIRSILSPSSIRFCSDFVNIFLGKSAMGKTSLIKFVNTLFAIVQFVATGVYNSPSWR